MSRSVRGSMRRPMSGSGGEPKDGHPSMSAPRRISGPAGRAPRLGPRAEPAAQPPLAERHRNHFFALLPPPAVRKGLALLAAAALLTGVLKLRLTQVSRLAGATAARGRQRRPCNSCCSRRPTIFILRVFTPQYNIHVEF